jgi:small subunit ribosomal protein S16
LAVRIRLTRVGATKRPSYRVVAIDSRRPRDGRSLEILGFYDPLTDPATVQIDADRLNAWIAKGARPSDTVGKLMRQAGMASAPAAVVAAPAKPKAAPKTTRTRKASAKAAAAKAAPAEAAPAEAAPAEAAPAEAATADESAEATTADESAEATTPEESTPEDSEATTPEAKAEE